MFPSKTFLSLLLIAFSLVDASPLSRHIGKNTLSVARRINERKIGTLSIAEMDRARAQAKIQAGKLGKRDGSVSVANTAVTYTAQVGVGNPPTSYTLTVDTGSANTWVGANRSYTKTSTSEDTGNTVSVVYSLGSFSGEEWVDTVTLAPGLVIEKQSIGVADNSTDFPSVDGILGVGPVILTNNTVSNTDRVPTVSDNLYAQKTISEEVLGIYYAPYTAPSNDGALTFGGIDYSKTIGTVAYVPLTTTYPASYYWGIDQSISYGGETILSTTAGIVDTGTTLILIATDAFQKYQAATGGTPDNATTLLKISESQYSNLKPLSFTIGEESYDLTPNGQIWPRSLNTAIGGTSDSIYLIVSDIGSPSGQGLDFINGYVFLERFYSVYDTSNNRVGLSRTEYTESNLN